MDDLRFYVFFSSVSTVSGRWTDDYERLCEMEPRLKLKKSPPQTGIEPGTDRSVVGQQNRALEAATITLRYFTALCPPMGKTPEIFDLHFLAKPKFFQANYCDFTKVEVPNCVLTCNLRNDFVAVRVYQAVKNPATADEFAADFSFMPE